MTIDPFKLNILKVTPEMLRLLKEVKVLNIHDIGNNFHPDGLFSTEIFGEIGSMQRMRLLGYLDLRIKVMHPLAYKHVVSLNRMYAGIMSGKVLAKWDDKLKDFIKVDDANEDGANTGFDFFISKLNDIMFGDSNSDTRTEKIKFMKDRTADDMVMDKLLVLSAGLRDYTVDEANKPSEDEINTLYRKVMINSNILKNMNLKNSRDLDGFREKIQKSIVDLYDFIIELIDGKNKYIQGGFSKRTIVDSTRNVITSSPFKPKTLEEASEVSFNDTIIGIHQFAKALFPLTVYGMKSGIIKRIFHENNNYAMLYNKETKHTERMEVSSDDINKWSSREGINSIINRLGSEDLSKEEIKIGDHYLLAIYDDGKKIKLIFNTTSLPEEYDKKFIRPITYIELIYLSIYQFSKQKNALVTRYPVANLGGIYPTKMYLKSTIESKQIELINDLNEHVGILNEFPKLTSRMYNTMSPHYSRLGRLGADFDGDQTTATGLFTDESNIEISNLLSKRSYYIAPSGKLIFSVEDTVLKNLINEFMK